MNYKNLQIQQLLFQKNEELLEEYIHINNLEESKK